MTLFTARGVVVDRDGRRSLDNVDFDLNAGEMVGLIGPNGAGKTTLLRALLGLPRAHAGEVRFEGTPIPDLRRSQLAQAAGYLPQGALFHWPLLVARAVGLGRFPHQDPLSDTSDADKKAIESAMETAGISAFAERRVDRLSGGETMRVHLARLLAGQHRCIVADEPITSLDVKYQLHFLSVLKRQAGDGTGVLISLHDLSLAARFCDRLIVLQEGRVVINDVPARALDDGILAKVFEIEAARLDTGDGVSVVPTRLAR